MMTFSKSHRLVLLFLLVPVFFIHAQEITIKRKDGEFPPAQMGISPPEIIKTFSTKKQKALNQTIVLYNYNAKPKRVTIELIDTNSKNRPVSPKKNTLSTWTILNPTNFSIPGNGQQTIRLSVRPPSNFPKKTHYALLKITQQVEEKVAKSEEGVVLKFGSSYALPVRITVK